MATIAGTNNNKKIESPARLQSVLLTSAVGGASEVAIYAGGDNTADPVVIVRSPAGTTSQYYFNDVSFPDGMLIVPSSDVDSFLVEYG